MGRVERVRAKVGGEGRRGHERGGWERGGQLVGGYERAGSDRLVRGR